MNYSLSGQRGSSFQEFPEKGNKVKDWFNTGSIAAKGASSYMQTGNTPWGAIGSFGKSLYNNISGKSPKEYSDVEQSIIFPLQGAAMGSSFGPWGALAGGLYGLSHSFKDDVADKIGLSENNFLYKLWDPIGMGDGKGFIDIG